MSPVETRNIASISANGCIGLHHLSLLKTPFLWPLLMLRATLGTLLAHDAVFVAFLLTLKSCAQSGAALQLEVLALRHQVQVLERSRPPRLRLTRADRLLWVWSATQPSLSQPLTNQRNLAIDASGRWWSSEWSVFSQMFVLASWASQPG
jgi:hypothetical protein